jgi:uncharacterized repeat protein (TIGR03803 family)
MRGMVSIRSRVAQGGTLALVWSLLSLGTGISAHGQTLKTLYSFTGQNDGGMPSTPLLRENSGTLYGAAFTSANGVGNGTIFKLSPSGKFSLLYAFPGLGGLGTAGANPLGGLVRNAKGDIYGVTEGGGFGNGYGVVFKVSASGKERVLHTFTGPPNDGLEPLATLVAGASGMFYGTTGFGGSGECQGGQPVCGIAFAIDSAGHYKIIHNFQGPPTDGFEPWDNLVQDAQGNIYGTTMSGGSDQSGIACYDGELLFGCGVVFKLSPNADGSWSEVILHNFTGAEDGYDPSALAIDATGNLYGASFYGASQKCPGGCGAIFKLDTAGKFTVIHGFTQASTGMYPYAVTLDAAGNLYGSTNGGNSSCPYGCGTIFKLDPGGKFTLLHVFNRTDGDHPGALFLDEKTGTFYGSTRFGGSSNWGTIFQLKP